MKSIFGFVFGLLLLQPAIAWAGDATARQAETLILQNLQAQHAKFAPNALVLASDSALADIARSRAEAMANGTALLSHTDVKGHYPPFDAVRAHFAPFNGLIRENIAVGNRSNAADANEFAADTISHWMASPSRRGNRIGIGAAINGNTAYAVAVFMGSAAR